MTSSSATTARKQRAKVPSTSIRHYNYGDIACGFSGQNVELKLDMNSDSKNEGALVGMMKIGSSFQKEILVVLTMM